MEDYKNPIYFYNRDDLYYEFTNFAPFPIRMGVSVWPTSEHYFQAMKFSTIPEIMEEIRRLEQPRDAFEAARKYAQFARQDWNDVKDGVMYSAVTEKFKQWPKLQEMLLATGDRPLIEHTTQDSYWGDGGGTGQNKLGSILEKVRFDLRQAIINPWPGENEHKEKNMENSSSCCVCRCCSWLLKKICSFFCCCCRKDENPEQHK